MSKAPSFITVAHGIDVPVVLPDHLANGPTPQGIAIGLLNTAAGPRFGFTISHPDGTVLTAVLDDAQYRRFLRLISAVTAAGDLARDALQFGEHG